MSTSEPSSVPTVGVEEEFLLVDADTLSPRLDAPEVLDVARRSARADDDLSTELRQGMLETGTPVCEDTDALSDDLVRLRRLLAGAAERAGARLLASGTHPTAPPGSTPPTPDERYEQLDADYAVVSQVQLVCGMHVHVGVPDRDAAVAAMDRARVWAPLLLALAANSPWWDGADTRYDSWRSRVWSRWPSAGPTGPFGDAAAFDAFGDALVATGAVLDRKMLYFDVRPSDTYSTLEWRTTDVCLDVQDAVVVAALARALTTTAVREAEQGGAVPESRVELLRAATWRAARSGVRGELVHPTAWRPVAAADALDALVEHVRPALEEAGDLERVTEGVARVLSRGSGAARQRAAGSARAAVGVVADATVP